jgi:hypothetical protein
MKDCRTKFDRISVSYLFRRNYKNKIVMNAGDRLIIGIFKWHFSPLYFGYFIGFYFFTVKIFFKRKNLQQ